MSDLCRFCNVVSRAACSAFTHQYQAAEIRSCPNLPANRRYGALIDAGLADDRDREISELRDRLAR